MAKSVKQVLDSLQRKDRDLLFYAFENGLTEIVDLGNGEFIGVNVDGQPNISIAQSAGRWCIGRKVA